MSPSKVLNWKERQFFWSRRKGHLTMRHYNDKERHSDFEETRWDAGSLWILYRRSDLLLNNTREKTPANLELYQSINKKCLSHHTTCECFAFLCPAALPLGRDVSLFVSYTLEVVATGQPLDAFQDCYYRSEETWKSAQITRRVCQQYMWEWGYFFYK